jgi:hypothetical protein
MRIVPSACPTSLARALVAQWIERPAGLRGRSRVRFPPGAIYGLGLAGRVILRKASMTSRRFGTGISSPLGVACFGSVGRSTMR